MALPSSVRLALNDIRPPLAAGDFGEVCNAQRCVLDWTAALKI
jgi:hypothetical protein